MSKKVVGQEKYTWWISITLLKELYAEDPAEYRPFLKMSPELFDTLHDLIDSQCYTEK